MNMIYLRYQQTENKLKKQRKIFLLIPLLLLLFSVSLVAQNKQNTGKQQKGNTNFQVFFDIISFKGDVPGKTDIKVFLQVPYRSLSFIKRGKLFYGEYSVDLIFYDKDEKNVLFEKIWNEKLKVKNYRQTESKKSYNISFKDILLTPGDYAVKGNIADKYSLENITFNAKLNVRKIDTAFGMSDVIFNEVENRDKASKVIIPNVSNIVTNKDGSLNVYYQVYSDKPRGAMAKYRIYSKVEDESFLVSDYLDLKKGTNDIFFTINNIEFKLGKYNLTVSVTAEDTAETVSTSKDFISIIKYYPRSITDLDQAIKEMVYIAPPSEIDKIMEAKTYSEKLKRFEAFWKSKDPSPSTPKNEVLNEYYRRVDYANRHFKHYFPGWKTDMGKIYITLGPPHQIDRHPLELGTNPYEIWIYYDLNRRFVFLDETGFGDYRLITPLYGDWYKYRQ